MERVAGDVVSSTTPATSSSGTGLGADELVHDLRQELAVVRHLVDLLSREDRTPQSRVDLLAGLHEQVEALDALVLSAAGPPCPAPVDPVSVAVAVVAALRPVFDGEVVLHAAPVRRVLADPVLLRRALLDLGVNACQAAPGGTVVVRVGQDADGRVRLEVHDDGPSGGDPELDRAGLGTWVVHAVVRDAGGTVERRPGRHGGREVVVRLPSLQEEP